jgi:hypothetical protein
MAPFLLLFLCLTLTILECSSSNLHGITTGIFSARNSTSSRKPRILVSFINGIYHSSEDWQRITQNLSSIFGCEVHAFYNPSSGRWLQDATVAGYELIRTPAETEAVLKLANHFREMLTTLGPRDRILHLAHSGGAIITYLCAKYHLSKAETDRIDVTTFGGGRSITRKYFSGRIVNYYSRNDPLLYIDKRAGYLSKHTANESFDEVLYVKHNTTFVFLHGLANNPVLDHSMEGVTYLQALDKEAQTRRRHEYLLYIEKAVFPKRWLRHLRKNAARVTKQRHFWRKGLTMLPSTSLMQQWPNSLSLLRRVRKMLAALSGKRGYFSGKYNANPIIIA